MSLALLIDILIAGFDEQGRDHDDILEKVSQVCRQSNLKTE